MFVPVDTIENNASELLDARERKALGWAARARLIFLIFGIFVAINFTGRNQELLAISGLLIVNTGILFLMLKWISGDRPVFHIGLAGLVSDGLVMCGLPAIWYLVHTVGYQEPLIHRPRHNFTAISFALIALNGLALRPFYPAILTAVSVSLHIFLAWIGVTDPLIESLPGGLREAIGIGIDSTDVLIVTPAFTLFGGVLITVAVATARAVVRETVAREQAQYRMREQQLQAVMTAKMQAVGDIVAGLQHEVNSPLGALQSATNTADKAIERIRNHMSDGEHDQNPASEKALSTLDQSLRLVEETGSRLSEVMASIRGFVQLDRADLQRVPMDTILATCLEMTRSSIPDGTDLTVDTESDLIVEVDPRRISDALWTVLKNACEAVDVEGKIHVRLFREGAMSAVVIQDGGYGISPEQLARIFDIEFAHGARTRARFGLPLCRSILYSHNGDIEIESTVEIGTTVTIRLPLSEPPGTGGRTDED